MADVIRSRQVRKKDAKTAERSMPSPFTDKKFSELSAEDKDKLLQMVATRFHLIKRES